MPFFKSTFNILKSPWEDEVFNENWMDSDRLVLPPTTEWDYSRPLTIEDVDIWEVLYEGSGGIGVYASWCPYAEFYMITTGWVKGTQNDRIIETHYGKNSSKTVYQRCMQIGIPLNINKIWIDPEDMWLYS